MDLIKGVLMRMWMVNPEMLCRKHLLGEHLECHMFVGTILAGKSLKGYVDNGLVEVDSLVQRHNDLAVEMSKRGYKHFSTLQKFDSSSLGRVDIAKNLEELKRRCTECHQLIISKTNMT
jgi:hypothetical protein